MGPEIWTAQPEILMRRRLVPEHLILQLVRLGIVVNDQALKILSALIHDLTE